MLGLYVDRLLVTADEAMAQYDVDAEVLQLDYGAAAGAAKETAGVFTREFAEGKITLDCNKWTSSFVPKK
jgi:hypothetical protein